MQTRLVSNSGLSAGVHHHAKESVLGLKVRAEGVHGSQAQLALFPGSRLGDPGGGPSALRLHLDRAPIHRHYPHDTPTPPHYSPILTMIAKVPCPACLSNKDVHFLHHPYPRALAPQTPRLTQRSHLLGEVRLAQAPEARVQHLERRRPSERPREGKWKARSWITGSRPQGTSRKEALLVGGHGSCRMRIPWNLQWAGVVFSCSPRPCPLPWPGRLRAHPAWPARCVSEGPRKR